MSDKIFPTILVGALGFFLMLSFSLRPVEEGGRVTAALRAKELTPFPEVILLAKSAYVYDLRTEQELFHKDADRRLPLASLTKLMSALVASGLSPGYGTVKVTSAALENYGDSGLSDGEKWSLNEILDYSLLTSSNDGIRAVALSLAAIDKVGSDKEIIQSFVTAMNRKASELKLKNTYFWNETGLDESNIKGGAYGSARDISMLLATILSEHPGLLEATREPAAIFHSLNSKSHVGRNTNALVSEIPGILASKTGFTDIAGGNLVFAFDPEIGHPIVVTILGSTAEGRFEDARKLVEATMTYIHQ